MIGARGIIGLRASFNPLFRRDFYAGLGKGNPANGSRACAFLFSPNPLFHGYLSESVLNGGKT
ncbi:MAG TPA: hypothetical protein VFW94_01260 [Candidatus Acidoferrales bacterium]|nr:hypothetical protein [Candidatus Acidoferrales bacterium]